MNKSTDMRKMMALNAFLSQVESKKRQALVHLLSNDLKGKLEEIPISFQGIDFDKAIHFSILEKVHWSWFLPTLKTYSENEQKLFLSSLNPHAAKNLARALTLSLNGADLTEIARSFFRKTLVDSLIGPENRLLPPELLPKSALSPLLELNKKELTRIIDLLSLYDLALELRQIVDPKTLKKVSSFLSLDERELLKRARNQRDPFHVGKLGLDRWDGSEETLRMLLHRRALLRFGAGLSGEDPDLIWYICHQLDIGRGAQLYKASLKETIPGVTEVIQKQLIELL